MMRRTLKTHVQQALGSLGKTLDKNGQFRGARRGKKPRARAGARGPGRPKKGLRASERHETRAAFRASEPLHVTLRAHPDVGSLRDEDVLHAVREALITVVKYDDFRVIQFSVQRTHIHLICEAGGRYALANGMKAFGISAAKHINGLLRDENGRRRRGPVFPDRYHVRILKTPTQVRNCLRYVLNNWRHHGEDRGPHAKRWKLDPFSSATTFEGWKEQEHRGGRYVQPPTYVTPLVWAPSTWLLSTGWRKLGLISAFDAPKSGHE